MKSETEVKEQFFTTFKGETASIPLPEKFTFPFYYEPQPLCVLAAEELQQYISEQTHWPHNFGIDPTRPELEVGKMFGVLVVQREDGELGYLSAFSGKLADMERPDGFIPHVLNLEVGDNFFEQGMVKINAVSAEIKAIEKSKEFIEQKETLNESKAQAEAEIESRREEIRQARKTRKELFKKTKVEMTPTEFSKLEEHEVKSSLHKKHLLRQLSGRWEDRIGLLQTEFDKLMDHLTALREKRKNLSAALQQEIFDNYRFLNMGGETKSLNDIFEVSATNLPPAGAGDCAAPKLLQYAFQHKLKPIAMAEFWWGASPKSKVRRHGQFYPACTGKCRPILTHMLVGMEVDPNPIIEYSGEGMEIDFLYEDEYFAVINKPSGLLSVPGKNVVDSVASRMKQRYPHATGPLIVHRLDQATSGVMLIAKSEEIYKILQRQFVSRKVKKRYVALLESEIGQSEGFINLPLRVDLDNRPSQLVCYEYGKPAYTTYKVVEKRNGQTRIHFYPVTGRTHQLRVHAAHPLGLNAPIVGDTLYGNAAQRLHLHAECIGFFHPITKEAMEVEVKTNF